MSSKLSETAKATLQVVVDAITRREQLMVRVSELEEENGRLRGLLAPFANYDASEEDFRRACDALRPSPPAVVNAGK